MQQEATWEPVWALEATEQVGRLCFAGRAPMLIPLLTPVFTGLGQGAYLGGAAGKLGGAFVDLFFIIP